jgi:predicted DNA-binding WGR domain protein
MEVEMEKLYKVDPEKHMSRWYSVGIQNTLVDGIAVIVGWGSLKSSFQQWRSFRVQYFEEAERLKEKIIAGRLRRGYSNTTWCRGAGSACPTAWRLPAWHPT